MDGNEILKGGKDSSNNRTKGKGKANRMSEKAYEIVNFLDWEMKCF